MNSSVRLSPWAAEDGEFVATVAERRFSGRFNVRVPESLHRELALSAAQEGVSLSRLISDRLISDRLARS